MRVKIHHKWLGDVLIHFSGISSKLALLLSCCRHLSPPKSLEEGIEGERERDGERREKEKDRLRQILKRLFISIGVITSGLLCCDTILYEIPWSTSGRYLGPGSPIHELNQKIQ